MDRLTIPDEPIEGGMRRSVVDARAVKEQAMGIYWRLKAYEDTGREPEEILTGVQLAEIACMQIRYKKMQELLEQAAECIENCYGRETDLSEAIRKEINLGFPVEPEEVTMIDKNRVILICDGVKNAPDTLQGGYTVRELQMYRAACDRIAVEAEKLSAESEGMPEPLTVNWIGMG